MKLSFSIFTKMANQCNTKKSQFLLPNTNLKIPKHLQSTYRSMLSKLGIINSKKVNNAFSFNINQAKKKTLNFTSARNESLIPKPSLNSQQASKDGKRIRIPFTKEEDEKIKQLVQTYGCRQWCYISSFIPGRTPKQCRDRYSNYLVPGLMNGQWTPREDELLTKLYLNLGPKWSKIQKLFPGRSTNSIKNRWNYFLCRQKNDQANKIGSKSNEINRLNQGGNENDDLDFSDFFSLNDESIFSTQSHDDLDESSLNNGNDLEDSYNYVYQLNEILQNADNENDDDWIIS